MTTIYETPNMEIVEFVTEDVITSSQLTDNGTLDWGNVEKPGWGQGSSW